MTRFFRVVAATLAVVAVLCFAPSANSAEGQPIVFGGMPGGTYYLPIPDGYLLQSEHAQKEMELLPKQKEQLQEIAKKYYESMQQDAKIDWMKLSQEERQTKAKEIRENYEKRTAEVKAEVDKVLLAHQKETLKRLALRSRLMSFLYSPAILDQINMTQKQKDDLAQIRKNLQDKMQRLQQESLDETFKLLSEQQVKQLEEIASQGYRVWEQPKPKPEK